MGKRVKARGPNRMRERGRTAVVLWMDEDEIKRLDKARGLYTPRATWCKRAVVHKLHVDASRQKMP